VSAAYCALAPGHPVHGPYHDHEYGFPASDESVLFERLVLEINQAGLSWLTVLQKRDAFRAAFEGYSVDRLAAFSEIDVARLMADPGIIRNRLKIEGAVRNARAFLAIQDEFGSFDAYCWQFVGGKPRLNRWKTTKDVPPTSPHSDAFSKDLKRRGFAFVGSTVIYAHMQAVGMVNDHLVGCFRYKACGG
jgi:DNA-3-methyladenine glycosylase I